MVNEHRSCAQIKHQQHEDTGGGGVLGEHDGRKMCTNKVVDEFKFINRIEQYSDATDSGVKITDGGATSEEELGPPLPPRPPPRPRNSQSSSNGKFFLINVIKSIGIIMITSPSRFQYA